MTVNYPNPSSIRYHFGLRLKNVLDFLGADDLPAAANEARSIITVCSSVIGEEATTQLKALLVQNAPRTLADTRDANRLYAIKEDIHTLLERATLLMKDQGYYAYSENQPADGSGALSVAEPTEAS